ncbi:MAG: hypothetical protein M4579_000120 [Chaenotheca gracillima]|nr:MAG: hypothetical protein M4579_000120 [Chaenotheca gracillima]
MATATTTVTANSGESVGESPYLQALQRDGFVRIPSLLTAAQVASLREPALHATGVTRAGKWPHFRTVPKQFPPWPTTAPPASEGGIWGVQHLLHPDMPGRQEFAKFYFSDAVLAIVEQLLELTPDRDGQESLVLELFNLLVAPEELDFELRWHRDDIPATAGPEEEMQQLQSKSPEGKQSHAQYNLALYPDSSLIVIPGSHRRVRTDIERAADPYEPSLPDQLIVKLEPGDAVFYDSNILHRGAYHAKAAGAEETRMTLHGSVGKLPLSSRSDQAVPNVRATAVLQHGVGAWVSRDDARFGIGERPERMRRNLMAMGSGSGVGYSLEG